MIFILILNWEDTSLVTTDLSLLIENINKLENIDHCCIEFWDNELLYSLNYNKNNIDLNNIYTDIMKTIDTINKNNTIKHDITVIEKDENNISIIDEYYRNRKDGNKIIIEKYEYFLKYKLDTKDIILFDNKDNTIIISKYLFNNTLLDYYDTINNYLNYNISKEAFIEIYKNIDKLFIKIECDNFLKGNKNE